MTDAWWILNDFGRKQSWPNRGTIPRGTEKNQENLSQDSWCPGVPVGWLVVAMMWWWGNVWKEVGSAADVPHYVFCDLKYSVKLYLNVVFFFSFSGWGETESTWYVGHCCSIVPATDHRWWWLWGSWWNEDWQGKPKYSEKTCPSATLSTTNPTWIDLGSNPGRRCGKSATNRLSYGTAYI
jgi:hypothetical protein